MIRVHGVGPVYWGIEHRDAHLVTSFDRRLLASSWLVEDLPPYRRSIAAARVRLGSRALHIGLCRKASNPHKELPQFDPTEIGKWGQREEADAEDTGADQVRPVEPGGPDRPDRVGDAPDGGTVPGLLAHQGTGPRVVAGRDGNAHAGGAAGDSDTA